MDLSRVQLLDLRDQYKEHSFTVFLLRSSVCPNPGISAIFHVSVRTGYQGHIAEIEIEEMAGVLSPTTNTARYEAKKDRWFFADNYQGASSIPPTPYVTLAERFLNAEKSFISTDGKAKDKALDVFDRNGDKEAQAIAPCRSDFYIYWNFTYQI